MNAVLLCERCGSVSIREESAAICMNCGQAMKTQSSSQNGVRKGLLQIHQRLFAGNRTFVPVIFDGSFVDVIASDLKCMELARFRDHLGIPVRIVPTDTATVSRGLSMLNDELESGPMSESELTEFTDFAIGCSPR